MKKYKKFTEEERWKDLIATDVPRFEKSVQYREVDAKPSQEKLIKLFDNDVYDICLERFENANGVIEIRMYLIFKRNIKLHIATNINSIWTINETNRHNQYATFGQIFVKHNNRVVKAIHNLLQTPKPHKTNLKRYLNILLKRTLKKYF